MSWMCTPQSSNVAGFDYDDISQILTVEFKNGWRYNYYDVPESIYEGLINAESKGSFLAHNVKGLYRYARI